MWIGLGVDAPSRELARLGCLRELRIQQRFPGVALTPSATDCISPGDYHIIHSDGLAVVDCSWNRLAGPDRPSIHTTTTKSALTRTF